MLQGQPGCHRAACLPETLPWGLPKAGHLEIHPEKGRNSASSPSVVLSTCSEAALVAGALLPCTKELWDCLAGQQDSVQGQHRHPQREDKIHCCSTVCNRAAGLCPGTAAEDLAPDHQAQDASTERDGGLERESSPGDEQMDWHFWMYRKNRWGPCLVSAHSMWTSIPSTWAWISKQADNCYPGYTFVSNRNRRWPCLSE